MSKVNMHVLVVVVVAAVGLAIVAGTARATTNPVIPAQMAPLSAAALASQPTLGTTTIADGSGYGTVTFSQDKAATTAMMTASGYLCGNVAYRAIVKWNTALLGWVSWTYDVHFGAYVCNGMVRHVNFLYNTVDSIIPTWSWCGTIASNWGPSLPYTSVHSYMEGCFTIADKIVATELPWARMTIGGNGGLWARSTGVY